MVTSLPTKWNNDSWLVLQQLYSLKLLASLAIQVLFQVLPFNDLLIYSFLYDMSYLHTTYKLNFVTLIMAAKRQVHCQALIL